MPGMHDDIVATHNMFVMKIAEHCENRIFLSGEISNHRRFHSFGFLKYGETIFDYLTTALFDFG